MVTDDFRNRVQHYGSSRYHRLMATIHISCVDASRDFAELMAMVDSGAEIIIEESLTLLQFLNHRLKILPAV